MSTDLPRKDPILLLGGTGKISSRIAPLLSSNGYPILLASRSGRAPPSLQGSHGTHFDWFDQATYSNPFSVLSSPISAIFLVLPPIMDPFSAMKTFIDLAVQKGVKRFVLLAASLPDVGDGPALEKVSQYIIALNVEYTILRPSWFMENFSEMQHVSTIRDQDRIVTAAGDGKLPFVSADDIAAVAYKSLTNEVSPNTDLLILGPELLSYDDVASILTEALGRKITHVRITEDELAAGMQEWGIPEDYAKLLAQLDTAIKDGREQRLNDVVSKVTGGPARNFAVYVGDCMKRDVWKKPVDN